MDLGLTVIYTLFAAVVAYQVFDSTRTNKELRRAAKMIQDNCDKLDKAGDK